MISSAASPSSSISPSRGESAESGAFGGWCEGIGIPALHAAQLARLAVRDTYENLLHYGVRTSPFRGAEFSVRANGAARLAFAPRAGDFDVDALLAPANAAQHAVAVAAREIAGADVLLGRGENGTKLYLQRPHHLDTATFRRMALAWLCRTGRSIERDDAFDFVCIDFLRDGRMTPKIYRVTDDRDQARTWLGASTLATTLEVLPDAQWVVTSRPGRLTLHARLFDAAFAHLDTRVARAFDELARRTPRRLVPTHLSWSEPDGAQTLYYMVDADA